MISADYHTELIKVLERKNDVPSRARALLAIQREPEKVRQNQRESKRARKSTKIKPERENQRESE